MLDKKRKVTECILAVNALQTCLLKGDEEGYINLFYSRDEMGLSAQRKWFVRYRKQNAFHTIEVKTISMETVDAVTVTADLDITFTYLKYQPRHEIYNYVIQWIKELGQCRVIWMERRKEKVVSDGGYEVPDIDLKSADQKPEQIKWWRKETFLRYVEQEEHELSADLYARAVPRTIRFRESHPFLEGASLLSNMMSQRIINIAGKIYDPKRFQLLANLHNALSRKLLVRLVREDRDNTWASKYLVPWYGYDELFAMRTEEGAIEGNCQMVMAVYYALLRLCGVPCKDLFVVRIENHEALVVRDGEHLYFVNSDEISELSERFLFHSRNIDKIYNEKWILTASGVTNLTDRQMSYFSKNQKIGNFILPDGIGSRIGDPVLTDDDFPCIRDFNQTEYYKKVVTYVFENSRLYPDSAFTWAKYAYQSLYVKKPESYLCWSVQSRQVVRYVETVKSMTDMIQVLTSFDQHSIFPESGRIMTADQVIRHKTGNPLDQATLLYAWYFLKRNRECAICLTERNTCFVFEEGGLVWFYELETDLKKNEITDAVVLAFDKSQSYVRMAGDQRKPEKNEVWKKINQYTERQELR